jgi:hypothetical protein
VTSISDGISRKPGRPRSAQADQAILQAALEELIDVGYEALSIEAVSCVQSGIGNSMIQLYRR